MSKNIFLTFKNDLPASVVVFFVALPLCLGIALASGAPLFSGLIAGIIGGVVVGGLSGSKIGVSGPAAGLAAIVLTAIGTLGGYENFLVAVVLGGVIQIVFGMLKAGIIGYYFPSSVIKGMLTGIGIIIILKQIPHFFGYDANPEGDILVVLHQMGNHGPAYYKRYPEEFEKFKPTCQTNELSDCTSEEIDNAYDNAILYTDYFLAQTIDLLKQNESEFETAMMYVSDHGESLGEFGLYLHGMPNFMAPTSQRQVPVILWLGESYHDADPEEIRARRDEQFTHDNVFHTLLGFMEIESAVYDPSMDIFQTRTEELARPRPSSPSSSIAVSSPPIEDTLVE